MLKKTATVNNISAKYMLRLIVKFLNRRDKESENLWYVLAALRGPDNFDYLIKRLTTSRIRGAIGLLPWDDCMVESGSIDLEQVPQTRRNQHFINHVTKAKNALRNMGII